MVWVRDNILSSDDSRPCAIKLREAIKERKFRQHDCWKYPRMGTDNQHRALVIEARQLRYTSVVQFLNAWPTYRQGKLRTGPDGGLNQVEAHFLFNHLRKVHAKLRRDMMR